MAVDKPDDTLSPVSKVDVLIVGAGPAGLMMAMWMAQCGIKTRIVDERGTKVFGPGIPSFTFRPNSSHRFSTDKRTAYNIEPSRSSTLLALVIEPGSNQIIYWKYTCGTPTRMA
jgi:pyruvate/2-oxoglutarate dehydrogenase complex dihydrolipoamide dehydrogenase (E3) component